VRRSLFLLFIISLAGCTVGPNYRAPETRMPEAWSELQEDFTTDHPAELTQWWTTFNDFMLDSLMARAVAANLDVRVAEARIREARAARGVVAAEGLPTIDASGSYSHSRRSENADSFGNFSGGGSTGNSAFDLESELFQAGFDATWELDVFGRVRRSVEAAEADIAAAEESRRDVLVTVLAEVARNYVELRGVQQQLTVARGNIATQQETVELTQARFQAGLTSALDVAQAEAQLATTQSQIPLLEIAIKQTIHGLGVLLGQEPVALLEELSPEAPIPQVPLETAIGLPSDLLRRRPDIRRAERELAAATARIGVATADLFPRFSLTGFLGLQSLDLEDIALGSSRFWTTGPNISVPLFEAGRIHANIRVQNARQEQALAQYEKTLLTALTDVENSLVAYAKEQARRRALAAAVDANRQAVDLANERYTKGLADFLNVLESQRSLYISQDQLVQSERTAVANLIALYKALGGGWEVLPQTN